MRLPLIVGRRYRMVSTTTVNASETVLMGAVAYDPEVVTIWEGFREWFGTPGLDFD